MKKKDKNKLKEYANRSTSYLCWRNPFMIWNCTLFDENNEAIIEFSYYYKEDKEYVEGLLAEIDERKKENGKG